MRSFPPVTGDLMEWARAMVRTLSLNWSQLDYKNADSRATQDGVLLWDPSGAEVVVSEGGAWVSLGGGGGGATDLGYTDATRVLTSSTGTDVTLPLVTSSPGLVMAAGTATITVPANSFEDTETVAATGVTAASRVNVWLAPHDDADENSPELLDIAAMQATPGSGTITVTMAFLTPTAGPIKLQWSAF